MLRTQGHITDFVSTGVQVGEKDGVEVRTYYSKITLLVPIPFDSIPEMIDPNKKINISLEEK